MYNSKTRKVECDDKGSESCEGETRYQTLTWRELSALGWGSSRKDSETYTHACPMCRVLNSASYAQSKTSTAKKEDESTKEFGMRIYADTTRPGLKQALRGAYPQEWFPAEDLVFDGVSESAHGSVSWAGTYKMRFGEFPSSHPFGSDASDKLRKEGWYFSRNPDGKNVSFWPPKGMSTGQQIERLSKASGKAIAKSTDCMFDAKKWSHCRWPGTQH